MTSAWIRNNVVALLALFVALSGSAVAANVANDQGGAKKAAKKKKAKPGPPGPAGPAGPAGPVGPVGPATGLAGGDLTGNYPNPLIGPDAVTGAEVDNNSLSRFDFPVDELTGSEIQEPTLVPTGIPVPRAWANVTDADGVGADPVLTASEGVTAINDGVAALDGFVCFDLTGGFTPDLIQVTDQLDDGGGTVGAETPPPLNCAAGFEASASNTPTTPTGDFYIAFFDLQ